MLVGSTQQWCAAGMLAYCLILTPFAPQRPAFASSPAEAMACVARECRPQLAACASNPKCASGLACAGAKASDPVGQVRCMDLYENEQMRSFAECVMTHKGCITPIAADPNELHAYKMTKTALNRSPPKDVPPIGQLLTGTWKVALGLNPAFDTFDCQVHEFFPSTHEGKGVGAFFHYHVRRPDGTWFERIGEKVLTQADPKVPYLLKLRLQPPYLGYEDEWLFLGAELDASDPWFVIRYHGSNAAWAGYGGLNVYTRSGNSLPAGPSRDKLRSVLSIAGIQLEDLTRVDNSCGST